MRLTSRQSISPWRVARRVFRHAASSKPPAANSRRHRHGTDCAAIPHPSTKLPPRKTARSDALSIEMGAPEARPPTAPESWLRVGSAPPLGSKPPQPRTQHLRQDQKGTPHRTPPGHSPPTRRIAQGPLGAAHTQSRIGRLRLSQADSRQGEERGEREREERGEGEGVCTRVEQGGCLWWAIVILRG